LEAFSDGVIAILITVMVFELKIASDVVVPDTQTWLALLPKLVSYMLSFLMLGVLWVNHHQLLHQIQHSKPGLLWNNLHLLFWMSLVPLATHLVGSYPHYAYSGTVYGLVFFSCAGSFTRLRLFALRHQLLHEHSSVEKQHRVKRKNRLAMALYLLGAAISTYSVYPAFVLYLLVPVLYLSPDKS
jgi:uncharacterized membrane protein